MLWKNRTLGTAETNDHSKYPSPHFTAFAGVLTGALRDPESVADAGQGGDGDEDADEVAVWNPDEQKDEQAELEDCRDADQRLAGDSTALGVSGEQGREDGGDAVREHVVADVIDAERT